MKQPRISTTLLILLLVSSILKVQAQALGDNDLKKAAREIIAASEICALITIDDTDIPVVRAMDAFLPNEDFIIWFGTNSKSRKVGQIQQNPNVTLYYFDKPTASYVTIRGNAVIINSDDMKQKHWKEEWSAFYPNYPDGFSLIRVIPKAMEIVSDTRGIIGDSVTWQPQKVIFEN
jgi:general stress protein 26